MECFNFIAPALNQYRTLVEFAICGHRIEEVNEYLNVHDRYITTDQWEAFVKLMDAQLKEDLSFDSCTEL